MPVTRVFPSDHPLVDVIPRSSQRPAINTLKFTVRVLSKVMQRLLDFIAVEVIKRRKR